MAEWKRVRLGEIAEYATNKAAAKFATTDNYVSTENMLPNKGGIGVPENLPSMGQVSVFYAGDILISNIRPYFKKIWKANKPGYCSNDVLVLHCKNEIISEYLYCILSADAFFEYVMAGAKGTKMPRGDKQHIFEYAISLPPLATQRKIAAVLGAIDDKIETNRKICANLEAQAQALFKSWFVDFEPFGGKMPSGWKEQQLSECINFQEGPGIRNWQYVENDGTKFINIRCIVDHDIKTANASMISNEEANGKYAHFMLHENDIVMSCSGTLGRFAIVRTSHLPLCLNTSVIRFFPKGDFNQFSWLYGYLGSKEFLSQQEALANGSVQANFGPTHLKSMKIHMPDDASTTHYHKVVYPLIENELCLMEEISTLAAMRDALLPKLMSGEIDVEKVEVA